MTGESIRDINARQEDLVAKFKAEGLKIWKEPVSRIVGGQERISLGFVICEVNGFLEEPERIARIIADVLSNSPVFD